MGFLHRASAAGLAGLAAAVITGCGSSGSLLSADQSSQLDGQLAKISQALNSGNCQQAANEINTFQVELSQLNGVNQTLQSILDQGASTIASLAERKCPTASAALSTATNTSTVASTTTRSATTTTGATGTTGNTGNTGNTGQTTIPSVNTTTTSGFTVPGTTTTAPPTSGGAGLAGGPAGGQNGQNGQ